MTFEVYIDLKTIKVNPFLSHIDYLGWSKTDMTNQKAAVETKIPCFLLKLQLLKDTLRCKRIYHYKRIKCQIKIVSIKYEDFMQNCHTIYYRYKASWTSLKSNSSIVFFILSLCQHLKVHGHFLEPYFTKITPVVNQIVKPGLSTVLCHFNRECGSASNVRRTHLSQKRQCWTKVWWKCLFVKITWFALLFCSIKII